MSLTESKLQDYKKQAAIALNSNAYPFVAESYVLEDGRLIAELAPEYNSGNILGLLPEYLSVVDSGREILHLRPNRWAPNHLD